MNRILVVIPFDLPWEHTADYAHQTARILAKNNTVVCYMQKEARSIKEYLLHPGRSVFWKKHSTNMFLYFPLYVVPFRRFQCIEHINILINILFLKLFILIRFHQNKFNKKILWLFYPEYVFMIRVFGLSYISIYDCVDYHIGSSPYKERREKIREWEKELILISKHFFVNSHVLYEMYKKKRKSVELVPQGFRIDEFQKPLIPADITLPSGKPVIGYVGGINFRLDYELLTNLIQKTPQYLYVFVGPIQENDPEYFQKHIKHQITTLFSLPNVHHITSVSKDKIPSIISRFDIGMIPYDTRSSFNTYCYPMKLFEYFYMGKPVISTPIKELKRFPEYVKIGNTAKDWETYIRSFLSRPWPAPYKNEQKKLAVENSWERKIKAITSYLIGSVKENHAPMRSPHSR